MDKEITYDSSRLSLAELIELRELQRKMRQETGSIEGYSALTVDELIRLEDLHYTMAGLVNPRKPAPVHVTVIGREFTDAPDSGVTAAHEPAAVAPGPAPAKPAAPATPAQPEKPKPADEDVVTAHRQLDSLMRFGVQP